ncbi:MAG: IclR family transcriptional regulator [Chloroflexi bacterium]|nr:MAG: IclR family transcriptional regulator [Chloroflexota bacterium]
MNALLTSQFTIHNSLFIINMNNSPKPYAGTQAVIRAMRLLKVFTDEQPEWGLSAIAKTVGLNKTTAYRLLTALESEGLLMRSPHADAFRLGPEIVVLGGRALRANDLRSVAKPALEHLAAQTGETATLEIKVDNRMLIIDEVIGDYLMNSTQSLGTRWPLHATSTGLAILAHYSDNELAEFLAEPLAQITPKTCISSDVLCQELENTRLRGYSVANETLEIGLVVVGAVVRNHDDRIVAAISLGAPAIRFTPVHVPEMGKLVLETAVSISSQLGYQTA